MVASPLNKGTKITGEFALHLNCPWRLIGTDRRVFADDDSPSQVLDDIGTPPMVCRGVVVEAGGAFQLDFQTGERLIVEPGDRSSLEYWRLFRPGSDQKHFVVGPEGVEA